MTSIFLSSSRDTLEKIIKAPKGGWNENSQLLSVDFVALFSKILQTCTHLLTFHAIKIKSSQKSSLENKTFWWEFTHDKSPCQLCGEHSLSISTHLMNILHRLSREKINSINTRGCRERHTMRNDVYTHIKRGQGEGEVWPGLWV